MSIQRHHIEWLEKLCGKKVVTTELIQPLWSGYGACFRATLNHTATRSTSTRLPSTVVVKCASPNTATRHPRGWDNDVGHQRKLRSFGIENTFYKHLRSLTSSQCYVPKHIASGSKNNNTMLVLEDLAAIGFTKSVLSLSVVQSQTVLRWLAHFHAQFLVKKHDISLHNVNVWQQGTYWHLATRVEELQAMDESDLKDKAHAIDNALNRCSYQTLVHGDAKVANFCFTECFESCAAVDFQYVGYGVGVKDVAYFLGSALSTEEQTTYLPHLLSLYFETLKDALRARNKQLKRECTQQHDRYAVPFFSEDDITKIEVQWRSLFSFACADFHRFLLGWSPKHWKIDALLSQQTAIALEHV